MSNIYKESEYPLIIFSGEKPILSSPSLTLASKLELHGLKTCFSYGLENESTIEWIKKLSECSAIIVVDYDGPTTFRVRQLAIAVALGIPVIRWWVGSDVLNCAEEAVLRRNAQLMSSICARNIVVASHLKTELDNIDIPSMFIPSVLDLNTKDKNLSIEIIASKILVYMPAFRKEFYGYSKIKALVEHFSNLDFIIVADTEHHLAAYKNVESLGWVEDMDNVWPQVLCVLRMTDHDGMPRMVLEALKRGKYAIYSWPLPGCHYAIDVTTAATCIENIYAKKGENIEGITAYHTIMTPPPELIYADTIKDALVRNNFKIRLKAIWITIKLSIKMWIKDNEYFEKLLARK